MNKKGNYRLPHPSRIYLETTTRCNLSCAMCVKNSTGSCIKEGDFDYAMLPAIGPALPYIESLILNGIGEPLLYSELEKILKYASERVRPGTSLGFQTNGMLVTRDMARSLIEAGLNLVCVSFDASTADKFSEMRNGGEISDAENAIKLFREEGKSLGKEIRIGIEFVMTKTNLNHLLPSLQIAAARGADFALVTHLIAYDEDMMALAAFDRNSDRAIELYEKTVKEAAASGVDITKCLHNRWKFNYTSEEWRVFKIVQIMKDKARSEGICFNLKSIIERDVNTRREVEAVFLEAEAAALKLGIELSLPAPGPVGSKRCDFIETGSVFVSWNGDVHPCHFLWHRFQCYISGWKKYVNPESFGNLGEKNIIDIWNSPEYVKFRETVADYDYPICSNCSLAPCDYIYSETFEQDCYTNTIPCCDCQWCMGIFQCLS